MEAVWTPRNSLHGVCQPGLSYTNKPSNQTGFPWGLRWDLSRRRICKRDETFIFSFFPPNISSPGCLASRVYVSLSLPDSMSSFSFLLSLSFLIIDRDKSSGLLAFSSSSEKKEKRKRRRRRKKSAAVSSSPLAPRDWKDKSFPWQAGSPLSLPSHGHHPYCHVLFSASVTNSPVLLE